jgi:hypothetical protein
MLHGGKILQFVGSEVLIADDMRSSCRTVLPACFMLVSYWPYSSTLKIEAMYSSETSVYFQRTT